jgi:hypothetical protein
MAQFDRRIQPICSFIGEKSAAPSDNFESRPSVIDDGVPSHPGRLASRGKPARLTVMVERATIR